MYVGMYICMYVCIYIYTHTHISIYVYIYREALRLAHLYHNALASLPEGFGRPAAYGLRYK